MSPAETVGRGRFEFLVAQDQTTGLTAPVGALTEPLEGELDVGQFLLDGIEGQIDLDLGHLDLAGGTGIIDAAVQFSAAGGRVGLHEG